MTELKKPEIGGFLQVQHNSFQGAATPSTFQIKRLHLRWWGAIDNSWKYFVQINAADRKSKYLRDGLITWKGSGHTSVSFGQMRIPYSIANQIPTYKKYLVVAAKSYLNFSNIRDVGVSSTFQLGQGAVVSTVGLFNGSGQNSLDTNDCKDPVARFSVYPFRAYRDRAIYGRLFFNYHGVNRIQTGGEDTMDKYNLGFDLRSPRGRLFGEYLTVFAPEQTGFGWYVTGSLTSLELPGGNAGDVSLRYEFYNPDLADVSQQLNLVTGGFRLEINPFSALQWSYSHCLDDPDRNEMVLHLQVQMGIR